MLERIPHPEPGIETDAPLDPIVSSRYVRFEGIRSKSVVGGVIGEIRFTVLLDGEELVTLMCSPWKLQSLVLGFLYLEGLIMSLEDVELLRVCIEDRLAEVRLRDGKKRPAPARRILTSGCSGGTSFGEYLGSIAELRLEDTGRVPPTHLYALMRRLHERASLYRQVRGCHSSLLADDRGVLVVAEDIGRHNTLDKIQGTCLLDDISPRGKILLTSGRISSEMLIKSVIMGVPIVCSRTSPTGLALLLAERLNVTVVGYLRQDTMNAYTHAWRIVA
jgi:FdhD protein